MFSAKQVTASKHFKVFLYENSSIQPLSETTLKEEKPKSVHRLILDQSGITFEEFVQKLKTKSIVTDTNFKLFYLDDQNDWVSLSDEEDWKILNSILASETVIKIVCQNIVPKSETDNNDSPKDPFSEIFKNFNLHGGRRGQGHCPFGDARPQSGCPWSRGGCRRRGGMGAGFEQFAPLIENVVGSLFNNPNNGQQQQGANPFDLSSLLNNLFPGAAQQQQTQENAPQQEESKESSNIANSQIPPQFNGWNDLIKNFCGNLNDKANNGSFNIPHFGIVCDGCGKRNFTGSRWNCADCGDFDFCQECFETKANDHFDGFHSFSQVEPKAKSFLSNFVKKMEGNQSESAQQETPTQQDSVPETQSHERTEQVLPEEKLDEELYPSVDNVTTSQLLSSQLDLPTAPVEQPQTPVEPTPVVEYAVEQQLLRDMGFVDDQANTRLLKKHNGNIQKVITDLL
ncbi:predicted protein [Naegleria gruberi]|uniref:Predicted protein n=1 Tax=Naegleria gruberi TaxID=5762 RepID=D2W1M7_NAEGR|nr:uncharacterized protein NAEGRDRAFT_82058 [Naegleria gruberi]EFC36945.1 predicted protein [Naegleria gruberi]|eukprot:XP_002669689.1 predicted protein [Naegleria gruberi strain NEG-M]